MKRLSWRSILQRVEGRRIAGPWYGVEDGWRRYRRSLEAAKPADRRLFVAVRRELARTPGRTLGDAYRTVAGRFGLSEVRVRSARSRVAAAARTA